MASDYLLELDGIKGESTDDKHKDGISLESFSWGVTNNSPRPGYGGGGGGGGGKATFQDFHFVKKEDSASPQLFLSCASGQHIKKATLTVRKSGGDQQDSEYLTIELENVMVTSFAQSTENSDAPKDTFTLNFAKILMTHTPQSADGAAGTPVRAGWDLATNKKV